MKNGRICERDGAIGMSMTEFTLEQTTSDWFQDMGYEISFGSDISPDLPAPGAARQTGPHGAGRHADRESDV